jgi:hypothetical protein
MPEDIRQPAEQDPILIRQQIAETRTSIAEKLEAIEEQVVDTVQNAKESVQETIETLKGTVQETVMTVKDTFDFRLQVRRHPWPIVGASLLAGLVVGTQFGENRRPRQRPVSHNGSSREGRPEGGEQERIIGKVLLEPEPGILTRFQDEINQLKCIALGAAIGVARDLITDALQERLPETADEIGDLIDRATIKLGAKPIHGHVLHDAH